MTSHDYNGRSRVLRRATNLEQGHLVPPTKADADFDIEILQIQDEDQRFVNKY